MENNTLCNRHSLGVNNHTKMYVTYTRIYGWSDYGGESSYQPGYRLENMMWMTLLVYDYIIPGEKTIYTANIIVNTILNNKLRNAQKRHIATEASVLVPKQMNLDYSAAGILLGNLLDNAIEACEKIEASKRWIAVNIIYKEHTLILKICNSKEIKKANIALSSKRHYKQSGIGIHSVTRVVERYNGTIEFLDLGDSFEVSAVLYGILSTENTRS